MKQIDYSKIDNDTRSSIKLTNYRSANILKKESIWQEELVGVHIRAQ